MASLGLNMVSGLGPFHHMGQAARRALGPLSSGSKDHGTHIHGPLSVHDKSLKVIFFNIFFIYIYLFYFIQNYLLKDKLIHLILILTL